MAVQSRKEIRNVADLIPQRPTTKVRTFFLVVNGMEYNAPFRLPGRLAVRFLDHVERFEWPKLRRFRGLCSLNQKSDHPIVLVTRSQALDSIPFVSNKDRKQKITIIRSKKKYIITIQGSRNHGPLSHPLVPASRLCRTGL